MAIRDPVPFAQLLSRYRLASGLTQEELAERAGISARGVSDLERGVSTRPRAYTVYQLAEALNLVPRDRALFEAAAYQWSVLPGDRPRGEHAQPMGSFLGALPPGPLAAREEEMQRVRQLLEAASDGAGRLLLLSGARGVGKTRLAQEIMIEATQIGFLVLTGRCHGTGDEDPLAPIWHALSALERHESWVTNADLVRRWQEILQLAKISVGPRLFQAISDLISLQATISPLALLLDDMQHAAPATVQLVDHLARFTRDAPVFLLVTYREAQLSEENPALAQEVQELTRERLAERIMVRRFIPEETATFAAVLMGEEQVSDEFADFLHRRSKGNPRYIEELVRSLGGRLELEGEIGAGAMGRVFAAYDRKTDREVAAKLMLARGEVSLETPHRFQQEGAMLAKLSHPNIVQVYDTFIEEHASCIIMERVDGRSLRQVLEEGPLSLPRVKHLAQQVVAALDHAHQVQIVHRDVKPDNIMVTADDQVKVTDFGIARILKPDVTLDTIATTGMRMGTPLYMAPEQIQDKRIDGRTDIYAMGAVLFHMVAGRPPFEGSDALAIAIKQLQEEPPRPSSINSMIPKDWDALILKAMAKEPGKRFQSAREMEQAIRALSDQANTGTETISLSRQPAAIRRFAGLISALLLVSMAASRRLQLLGAVVAAVLIAVVATLAMHSFTSSQSLTTVGRNVPHWGFPSFVSPSMQAPSGVAVSAQGNVYVADTLNNRVVELSAGGLPIAQWGSPGSGPGQLAGPKGVAIDPQGNVYVADTGNRRVQEFSPNGTWLAQWFKPAGWIGNFTPVSLAVDGRGHIYAIALQGGFQWSNVVKFGPGIQEQMQSWPADSASGVAVDVHGSVYFADIGGNAIGKLSPEGNLLATWSSGLNQPSSIALDTQGNMYVTETISSRIVKLSATGKPLASWRGESGSAGFRNPEAVAVDLHGNVYVADTGNNRTVKLSPAGIASSDWNKRPSIPVVSLRMTAMCVDSRDNIWAVDQAQGRIYELSPSGNVLLSWELPIIQDLRAGWGIAVDTAGRVYVVATPRFSDFRGPGEILDYVIAQISSHGKLLTQWGSSGIAPGGLDRSTGLAIDRQGNVYVADTGNYRIQKFSPSGQSLGQWGSLGSGTGQFEWAVGVALDRHGNSWVIDNASNRIDEFSPTGKPLAMWGKLGSGPGEFRGPMGIAVDTQGDVYVADTGNNRIQKLSPDGRPLAQSGTKGFDPGEFLAPYNVSVDSHGNVYVLDWHGIHKLTPSR